jgi:hypothetical protein
MKTADLTAPAGRFRLNLCDHSLALRLRSLLLVSSSRLHVEQLLQLKESSLWAS